MFLVGVSALAKVIPQSEGHDGRLPHSRRVHRIEGAQTCTRNYAYRGACARHPRNRCGPQRFGYARGYRVLSKSHADMP